MAKLGSRNSIKLKVMPDISMCKNDKCKFKEDCYRFTAKPSEFIQAYGDFNCKDKTSIDTFFWKSIQKCKCKEPILQTQTKQCGKCKKYIDRVRHILLTNQIDE